MNDMRSSERWIIGSLLAAALLTFFFPLASLQVPVLGAQEVSGYELLSKAKEFNQTLDLVKAKETSIENPAGSEQALSDPGTGASHSTLPFSVQALPIIPIEIVASFGCALSALICCIVPLGSASVKTLSAVGAATAVFATLHLTIANSDLHTWFLDFIKADSSTLVANPFGGLAQQVANMAANSIQLKPGTGLFVLASTLSFATIILLSGVLSTDSLPADRSVAGLTRNYGGTKISIPTAFQSDRDARAIAFFVVAVIIITAATFVLIHKPQRAPISKSDPPPTPNRSSVQNTFKWPSTGLPAYITDALNTEDLSPTTPGEPTRELTLGVNGQRQFIPPVKAEDCMGSGGCVWDLRDAATMESLIEGEQGALHKTEKITDGYHDLLVEGKLGLYVYEYQSGKYKEAFCYKRSEGPGGQATPTPCLAEAETFADPKASMGFPVSETTFVNAYVLSNEGLDDLSNDQLVQLAHDEYKMGLQIETQTLLLGGGLLSTRGKRAMDYLDNLRQQQRQTQ